MLHRFPIFVLMAALGLGRPAGVAAQLLSPPPSAERSPFARGVPSGPATAETVQLTLADAAQRALTQNLGVLLAEERNREQGGARTAALAELLPHVTANLSESRRKTNLEAFGFPLAPEFPRVVGPFNVFDGRILVSQPLLDWSAARDLRAATHELAATRHEYRSARDLVVLVVVNLYLETLAANARAEAVRAQLDTASALHRQAMDMRASGLVAGIDVVRAEVRVATERQRSTAADNAYQKSKLALARVIGLPPGQPFELSRELPEVAALDLPLDTALERAHRERPDYLAALERVRAAEATRDAIAAERWPTVRVTGDYGAIGLTPASARATFSVAGFVDVPVFEGGRISGRLAEADAAVRSRRAEAEDASAGLYYDVRSALLDVEARRAELDAATRGRELAALQLEQARDRFAAGITSNVEVVQAQEAVALASEQYITGLYGFNVAKAMLARAVGSTDAAIGALGGASVR